MKLILTGVSLEHTPDGYSLNAHMTGSSDRICGYFIGIPYGCSVEELANKLRAMADEVLEIQKKLDEVQP